MTYMVLNASMLMSMSFALVSAVLPELGMR